MKKLFLISAILLTAAGCVGCTNSEETAKTEAQAQQTTKTVPQTKKDGKTRLKNKMIIVGDNYQSSSAVAYLLLDDDSVVMYKHFATGRPFTLEQAQKILQLATEPIYIGATIVKGDETKGISKILMVIDNEYKAESCVAYLQHTDGTVEVSKIHSSRSIDVPFNEKEAAAIMTDIGDVVELGA